MQDAFHDRLIAMLPRLRVQAIALTRNRPAADDLVQETVVKALAARDSFQEDTNFPAWLHRILRNAFISNIRRRRPTQDLEAVPAEALARPGNAMDSLLLRELSAAMAKLSPDQRQALLMVSVEGMSYEEVAEAMDCAVGTAKCRVFRARRALEKMLAGEEPAVRRAPAAPVEAPIPVRKANQPCWIPETLGLKGTRVANLDAKAKPGRSASFAIGRG